MNTTDDHDTTTTSAAGSAGGVIAGLQEWARHHDRHVQAAVWLLIEHDTWPRRGEFRRVCRRLSDGRCWGIDWAAAREVFDAGGFDRASSSERAVLDLAIELGRDRYRLSLMGSANARTIAAGVAHALGGPR